MKKTIKIFTFIALLLVGTRNVKATEYEDNLIKRIAPDGSTATFKTVKPTSNEEADNLLNSYIDKLLNDDDYYAYITCTEPNYTSCQVGIQDINGGPTAFNETYDITITYEEPETNEKINNYISQLPTFNEADPTTYFFVEDLNLINYYNTSTKSELWNKGAPSRALKYSNDVIKLTKGNNIFFNLQVRAGIQEDGLMYESAFGGMNIYYNGDCYGSKYQGIYFKRVIYIPENTAETKEAYVAAAQKRINDYLVDTEVEVTYGGLLSSLEEGATDPIVIDPADTDGNYYNIEIKAKSYKFYIIKGTAEQLAEPTYLGNDIITNIEITSNDSFIPLDTSLTVRTIVDDNIKEVLKTDNYAAYDIKLYSDGKGTSIEKLKNGKYLVKIPVPPKYEGKKLVIYYINAKNETKEYEVTIKDNMAQFETDHFSTYILTEAGIVNPKTGDNIGLYIALSIASVLVIAAGAIYLKKKTHKN